MLPVKFESVLNDLKVKMNLDLSVQSDDELSVKSNEVEWSKGPAYSLIPFGLELSGIKPSSVSNVEPKSKKNCYRYLSSSGVLLEVIIYGSSSAIIEKEIYFSEGDSKFAVRYDLDGEAVRASVLVSHNGMPCIGCRLEDDGEYWCYEYKFQGDELSSMLVYATNSVPGTEIFLSYDDNCLSGLYFYNGAVRVPIYENI
ncbi:hypothetical protein D3C77_373650 [compost metagenome]